MLKVGITGGIGSGKSLVSKILQSMNFPVFYSDLEAKKIIQENKEVKEKLIALFGAKIFLNNQLNRTYFAGIIFSDNEALKKVNAIVHPLVRWEFEEFAKNQTSDFVFNEAAILFESGGHKQMDKVVLVSAPEEMRIERVMKRDEVTKDQVIERMSNQWSDEQKRQLADFEIINDETHALIHQIEKMLNSLG